MRKLAVCLILVSSITLLTPLFFPRAFALSFFFDPKNIQTAKEKAKELGYNLSELEFGPDTKASDLEAPGCLIVRFYRKGLRGAELELSVTVDKKTNEIISYTRADKNTIIRVASDKAKALGYDASQMNVVYDEGNQKALEYFKQSGEPLGPGQILAGANYQVVYFGPKKMQAGGDLWVFFNRYSGKAEKYRGSK